MESFGVDIKLEEGYVIANAKGGLKGAEITFPFISVGATEHALLTAGSRKLSTSLIALTQWELKFLGLGALR